MEVPIRGQWHHKLQLQKMLAQLILKQTYQVGSENKLATVKSFLLC